MKLNIQMFAEGTLKIDVDALESNVSKLNDLKAKINEKIQSIVTRMSSIADADNWPHIQEGSEAAKRRLEAWIAKIDELVETTKKYSNDVIESTKASESNVKQDFDDLINKYSDKDGGDTPATDGGETNPTDKPADGTEDKPKDSADDKPADTPTDTPTPDPVVDPTPTPEPAPVVDPTPTPEPAPATDPTVTDPTAGLTNDYRTLIKQSVANLHTNTVNSVKEVGNMIVNHTRLIKQNLGMNTELSQVIPTMTSTVSSGTFGTLLSNVTNSGGSVLTRLIDKGSGTITNVAGYIGGILGR